MNDGSADASRSPRIGKLGVVSLLAFLAAMAQGNLALGLLFYARDVLHASRAETGLLAGVWFLVYMISCHVWRPLSHRFRPRFCVLGASLSLAVLTGLFVAFPSLPWAFVLNGLAGTATASFWPPLMGWLSANADGELLNRRLGVFNLSWSGGAILSPALAGWGNGVFPELPVLFSCWLYLAAWVVIVLAVMLLPGIGNDDDAHDRELRNAPSESGGDGTPLRFPAWLGLFSTYLVAGAVLNVFPIVGRTELGMDSTQVGFLFLLRAFATSAFLGILGRTRWWHFRGWQMVCTAVLLGGSLVWLAAVRSMAAIALALIATGVFTAFGYVNSIFHGAVGSSRRVARMALHESLLSAGLCCGASFGGVLYQSKGAGPVFAGCALFMAASAGCQLLLLLLREGVPESA